MSATHPATRDATPDAGVDVGAVVDAAPLRGLPLRVFVLTVLALIADGFDIQAIAFAAPALLPDWGVTRADLAPVLAAGLVGMGLGSMTLGGVGDRWGRRPALIGCMVLVAVGSLLCATADDLLALGIYRFVVGLGLGGALPNASALIAEYAPARHRSFAVAAAIVGVPLGGLLGAEVAAHLVPPFGWRSVFWVGGLVPAVLALAMAFALPESPRFLARRAERRDELVALLRRLGASVPAGARFVTNEPVATGPAPGVAYLWSAEWRRDTAGLWLAFFASVFAVYSFFSWLPTVLADAGLPLASSIRGALVFNVGGVIGSLLAAWLMQRLGSRRVLLGTAVLGIATTATLATIPVAPGVGLAPLWVGLALAGACINGVQVGLYPLAAHVYPTAFRARGVGWALGVARAGGVLSAFAGSAVLALGDGTAPFFLAIACVIVGVVAGLLLIRRHVAPVS